MPLRNIKEKISLRFVFDRLEVKSPYGRRMLQRTEYYADRTALQAELDRLTALRRNPERLPAGQDTERIFGCMKDLTASAEKICRGDRLTLEELFDVKCLLLQLEELRKLYDRALKLEGLDFLPLDAALAVLDPEGEGRYEFELKDGLSQELLRIRQEKRGLEKELFGKKGESAVRSRWEAVCLEEDKEEKRLMGELCLALKPHGAALLADMESAGHLDLLLRKAAMPGTIVPRLTEEKRLCLRDMTEPYLAERFAAKGRAFHPVSLELCPGAAVLTGANMGGKSVALKTLALNCALALCGFPVYAKEALLPELDDIRLIAGEGENEAEGLSSFGGEMSAIRDAAESLGKGTLFLLDEPVRGTNPTEGAALVKGLTTYLNGQEAYSLVTTHFDGVSHLGSRHYTVEDYRPAERALDAPIPREALRVCRELGLQDGILSLAEKYLEI